MRLLILGLTIFTLSGCGVSYFSPSVQEEVTASGEVRVAAITAASISTANGSRYRPKTLPAVFTRTAGGASGMRAGGALPAPAFSPETRPSTIATRLPPAYTNRTYHIGVGDVVLLATPQSGGTVAELTGLLAAQNRRQGYTVQSDGAIAIPDIGRVKIDGLTVEGAEEVLFQKLVENRMDPTFSLEIAEFRSQRVALGGALRQPAVVPITLTSLHLGEAISSAGGLSTTDTDYVVIRLYRDGTMYQIPWKAYLETPNIQNMPLKGGDSVFVDTEFDLANAHAYFEEQIRISEFRQRAREIGLSQLSAEVALRRNELTEARANYQVQVELDAVDRDYVYLTGEVGDQGRFTLPFARTASLADALFSNGEGVPTETGNIAEVYVLRASEDGLGVTAWHLDARNIANLVLATRFELRPNDIIFVAEQPVTRWHRVINQITPSLITTAVGVAAN